MALLAVLGTASWKCSDELRVLTKGAESGLAPSNTKQPNALAMPRSSIGLGCFFAIVIGCIAPVSSTALNAGAGIETPPPGESWMFAQDGRSTGSFDRECSTRFAAFVRELDMLLASNPPTIYPVHDLINKSFPVFGCDIHEAIAASQQSRFFSHTSDETVYYVIAFDSRGFAGRLDPGFHVQINLLKASGNSWLPSANVNRRTR